MNPDDIALLKLFTSGNYLALFMLAAAYVRKLASPSSGFPAAASARWAPTISASAGLVYGVLAAKQHGATWAIAILTGVVAGIGAGFLDGLLVAIFGKPENAPPWARWLVFVADDVAAPPPPPTTRILAPDEIAAELPVASRTAPTVRPPSAASDPDVPPSLRSAGLALLLGAGVLAALGLDVSACTPATRDAAAADGVQRLDELCAVRSVDRGVQKEPPQSASARDAGGDR